MLMPQESLQKLVQVLEQQGTQQEILQQLDQQNQLQVLQAASNMPQNQQMPPAQPEAAGPGLLSQQPA
jgi:predicted patatin/cPLA2 family phospholipase